MYLPRLSAVQFDTARVPWGTDHAAFELHLAPEMSEERIIIRYWAPAALGSHILAFWGNGFSGLLLDLTVNGDSLAGLAYTGHDTPGSDRYWGRVVGHRASCLDFHGRLSRLLRSNQRMDQSGVYVEREVIALMRQPLIRVRSPVGAPAEPNARWSCANR
jgi:hypothetical protein